MRYPDLRRSARRVAVARIVLLLAFAGLGLRAAHLSVFDQRGAERGRDQSLRTLTLPPERGAIFDRNGAVLALSVDAPSVYAVPSALEDPARTAQQLALVLGLDAAGLAERLRRPRGFLFVARWVDEERADRVLALGLRGVGVVEEPRRIYPLGELAARVLGFANIDGQGVRGIEQQEDDWLRGSSRRLPVERDGSGDLLMLRGGSALGTAGGDVALTIDATLQADAERALSEAVTATGAKGGLVLAMDARSGDVLALAEAPSFDPNRFRELVYATTGSGAYLDALEPGSVLKAFLVAAALERGVLSDDERIDCGDGTLRIPGKTIRDLRAHGELDAAGILRVSSNIGAVKVAQALGRSAHFDMLRRFGFGESTHSRFPDESAGVLRPWRRWRPVDHATIAFGQGVSVTPIQLAAATAVLANGGEWVRPRLVAGRRAADGPWQPARREVARRVLGPETARSVVAMLETVVGPEGTGNRAALAGVRVAGKTGTAQKFDSESGRYSDERFRAWFVGIAPVEDPRLVVVTQLDEPQRPQHTGGSAAAPLFARVAGAQLAHVGIFPTERSGQTGPEHIARAAESPAASPQDAALELAALPPAVTAAPAPPSAPEPTRESAPAPRAELPAAERLGDRILLPDLRGYTVEEVMQITEKSGLRAKVSGSGRAIRQDPPPGTVLAAGEDTVRIEFAPGGARSAAGPRDGTRARGARNGDRG